MRLNTRRIAALGGTIALLAALVGCSSSDTPDSTTDAGSGSTSDAATSEAGAEGTFASGNADTLVFATLPDHEGAEQDAEPIADWIAEITGKNVQFFPATDYTAVVQGLAAGQIDIAQISAFTYYQSQAAGADIVPIGAQITEEGAEPGYYSVAVKNPASSATALTDFADQPVCFVNATSTSGRAIPVSQLLEAGVTVSTENTVYGEAHDLNAIKISEGTDCQVGFVQDVDANPLIASGKLVEVDRFLVPAAPIVMQAALPQDVQDQLVAAIADSTQASLTDAGIELNTFLEESWFGFGAVDDAYYDTIRTVCEQIADQVEACQA
ncbi:PhnD/SsuA/transferrin family substrate-binding protein [Microbacterium sp. No. 7]|uniref:PhnD/SsuA/transferrin family substrate-binding protein n=1 Tax=Microbacterium sp. No. 7 TaxID=1714373 RepID=UPI001E56073F|nr:PhnD/SsuA/transferrin family substrate-binding protein [Microbacterium sp. No. 7]